MKQGYLLVKCKILFLSLLCLGQLSLFANANYLLKSDVLMDDRSVVKINEIGHEVFAKTGVNIYIHAKNTYSLSKSESIKEKFTNIKEYENNLLKELTKPYVLLTFSLQDTHVNLIQSKSLNNIVDKNEVLNSYVIPLLASKDKNSTLSKVSAALLNGYDEIASQVSKSKGLDSLDSALSDSGKTFSTIWKVFMYTLVLIGVLSYTVIVLRSKKR